jgi:IS30 family transposase
MGTSYNHLSSAERRTLMVMLAEGLPPSTVAHHLGRSRSTISRELGRNRSGAGDMHEPYDAIVADERARSLRVAPGLSRKLGVDTPLFGVVQDQLREGWSPEQIAGRLEQAFPDDSTRTVSHETIYTAIYVLPRGSLRTDLILLLRHGHTKRRPRARGQDRGAARSRTWSVCTLQGATNDHASTQRCRYTRSSSGMRLSKSSISIVCGFSTIPSSRTCQGRIGSACADAAIVFCDPNS